MVNDKYIRQINPSAYIINIRRSSFVNQQALKKALKHKTNSGAALDVFESEPPEDLEFLSLLHLKVTLPHRRQRQ